jgi:hypothetical protein
MNDNDVLAALIASLRTSLDSYGLTTVGIEQSYQPRQIGINRTPTVYLHKIMANRWGWVGRKDVFNTEQSEFNHSDVYYRAATFQIDGLALQDPRKIDQLTASDLVETSADALQSLETIESLAKKQIRIERITQIRENYFIDDRDRHEQVPSFDCIVTYLINRTAVTPPVTNYRFSAHSI